MTSKYHKQKKELDSFKDNIDSEDEKIYQENLITSPNQLDVNKPMEVPSDAPYVMTIEIDKGLSEKIDIFYDSIPEELAFEFCKKHNLDFSALNYLVEEIKNVLNQNFHIENDETEPIHEEEEDSIASESIQKYEKADDSPKKEESTINPFPKNDFLNNFKGFNNQDKNKKVDNLKNNIVNQSTLVNENNFTTNTEVYINTASNQNVKNTDTDQSIKENYLIESSKKAGNSNNQSIKENYLIENSKIHSRTSTNLRKANVIEKDKGFKTIENKLFSYQFFLDKHKSMYNFNTSLNTLNSSNNRSLKNLSNVTVFDKLYKDAKNRKQTNMRVSNRKKFKKLESNDYLQKLSDNKINKNIITEIKTKQVNVGERLYQKGLSLRDNVNNKITSMKEEQILKNKLIYTFKPKLVKNSPTIKALLEDTNDISMFTRFDNYRRTKDENIKQLRELHEDKVEYSFSPKIDIKSAKMVKTRYESLATEEEKENTVKIDKNRELFELSRLKPLRIKNLELSIYGQFNYQPTVNPNSNLNDSNFFVRQESFSKRKNENKLKLIADSDICVDKYTGQMLFSPKIKSIVSTRNNVKNVYDHLYTLSNKIKEKIRSQSQDQNENIINNSNQRLTHSNTDTLFNQMKINSFKKFFKILDSDEDGIISIFCIDLKKIPENITKFMHSLMLKLKENGIKYNQEEFIFECDKIYNSLSHQNKKIFLNFNNKDLKHNQSVTEFRFKPEINSRSRKIDDSKTQKSFSKTNDRLNTSINVENKSQLSVLNISNDAKIRIIAK